MINPEHADILTTDQNIWYSDNYKYVEDLLFPGQQIYVAGEFSTLTSNSGLQELNTDMSQLLAKWKKNKRALLERFDTNHDGKIDFDEWEVARKEAFQEISQQTSCINEQPNIHIMGCPQNGQPFVISNLPEKKLHRQSLLFAWSYLLVFFTALGGAFWVITRYHTLLTNF